MHTCRVIGKNGETIKALQQFTGAQIQIDQRSDPTRVSIAGAPKAMQMATSMVQVGRIRGLTAIRQNFASSITGVKFLLRACISAVAAGHRGRNFQRICYAAVVCHPSYQGAWCLGIPRPACSRLYRRIWLHPTFSGMHKQFAHSSALKLPVKPCFCTCQ